MAKRTRNKADASSKYKFKREKSHNFTILDGDKKEVGTLCVRPESVGWKQAGETHWYRLPLADFRQIVVSQGTKGEEI